MKQQTKWFLLCGLTWVLNAHAVQVGEHASYIADIPSDRTSWLLSDGEGHAKVAEYREDGKLGAGYLVTIDYKMDIMFVGERTGSIGLWLPAAVFSEDFYQELKNVHPVDLGGFTIDYEGVASATDSDDNTFQDCLLTRIYDIDQSYLPLDNTRLAAVVLWTKIDGKKVEINDLEIKIKRHFSIPVLGAVQLDVSGTVSGTFLMAGFNLVPNAQ